MFYQFIKLLARFSLLFFFKRKIVCGASLRDLKGPAIIAANHPNSMMDAALIACLCKQQVHFTIRSDMFNNPLFRFLLQFLNGIPIYRVTEEKDKVKKNFNSIEQCKNLLQRGEIILVFSEGVTEHNWKLKPIKSATSRIVQYALLDDRLTSSLQVVPVGLTYSNYDRLAKTVSINVGSGFYPGKLSHPEYTGAWKQSFNARLYRELHRLIPELKTGDPVVQSLWRGIITNSPFCNNCREWEQHLENKAALLSAPDYPPGTIIRPRYDSWILNRPAFLKNGLAVLLLILPGLAGIMLNALFYFPIQAFAKIKSKGTIFYDSLFIGLATILYPIYIVIVAGLLAKYAGLFFLFWMAAVPLGFACAIQLWSRGTGIINYFRLSSAGKKYLKGLISVKKDQ